MNITEMPQEELDFDLKIALTDGPLGQQIDHPIVKEIIYIPAMNYHYNRFFRQQKERIELARKEGDWGTYLFLHARPYRLEAFMKVRMEMEPSEYWSNLSEIWVDSENIWQNKEVWQVFLSANIPNRHKMMDYAERRKLDSLPDRVKIYRGYGLKGDKGGFSYTLSKSKAKWFSERFGGEGKVKQLTVDKKDIVAFLSRRNEQEIIYIP